MRKKEQEKNDDMFPIKYEGKLWKEEDCDDIFLSYYDGSYSLNRDCAVYVMDNNWIFPDGSLQEHYILRTKI
jgi:hypothetical protein